MDNIFAQWPIDDLLMVVDSGVKWYNLIKPCSCIYFCHVESNKVFWYKYYKKYTFSAIISLSRKCLFLFDKTNILSLDISYKI